MRARFPIAASVVAVAVASSARAALKSDVAIFGGVVRPPDTALDVRTGDGARFSSFPSVHAPSDVSAGGLSLDLSMVDDALWIPLCGVSAALASNGPDVVDARGARYSVRSSTFASIDLAGVGAWIPWREEHLAVGIAVRGSILAYEERATVTQESLTVDAKASATWFAATGDVRLCVGDDHLGCLAVKPILLDERGFFEGATIHLGGRF
jgi:hypothetical protein